MIAATETREWTSDTRLRVAELLSEISKGRLKVKTNKGYLALQPNDDLKRREKNAVSVLRQGVSFSVEDYSAESTAKELGILSVRGEPTKLKTIKRLRFPKLQTSEIEEHLNFFEKLIEDAQQIIIERKF